MVCFFFSSRRRHTRCGRDWSSDVCSSDLEEESALRPSLIPGLLLAAQRNVARRALPVRLFELGIVFGPGTDRVVETERLGFVLTGPTTATWHVPPRELDFFDGK